MGRLRRSFRPQQGLPIMNFYVSNEALELKGMDQFPSPTGVTYYECKMYYVVEPIGFKCFRPQQGLPIMNTLEEIEAKRNGLEFPSPTGVTYYE